ncbi:MAG: phospho-N-acetylmuramoyl-pentapeptide-transferase [Alphaproteobacteria bacterium]
MLYNLLPQLDDYSQFFNLFRYITVRTAGALITALIISFIAGPKIINWLKKAQDGASNVREDTPDTHLKKSGTPSMGGLMILLSIISSTLLWADITNKYIWVVLIITAGYGLIGLLDDYLKLSKKDLSGKLKLLLQVVFSFVAVYLIQDQFTDNLKSGLAIPFMKNYLLDLGMLFIPFAMLVIIGSSNAVNLTDGLDGLAIVPVMIAGACFGLIAYIVGNVIYSEYLFIPYVKNAGEIAVFCGALVGASLGFLWFNAPPAKVFMGDTGSLSLGGALGAIAVITKHELVLAIIGGVFVLETTSVIIQVISFKLTGKRVFAMAPLHHHYEKKGWQESTIVIRFWIIALILAIIGLATLKLR